MRNTGRDAGKTIWQLKGRGTPGGWRRTRLLCEQDSLKKRIWAFGRKWTDLRKKTLHCGIGCQNSPMRYNICKRRFPPSGWIIVECRIRCFLKTSKELMKRGWGKTKMEGNSTIDKNLSAGLGHNGETHRCASSETSRDLLFQCAPLTYCYITKVDCRSYRQCSLIRQT